MSGRWDDYEDAIEEFYESMKHYTKEDAERDRKDMEEYDNG